MTHLQRMKRQQELMRQPKVRLVGAVRDIPGQAMPVGVLRTWLKEELAMEIIHYEERQAAA